MALTHIIEKIKKDAEKEAEKILSRAEHEKKEIQKDTENQKEKIKRDFDAETKKILNKRKRSFSGKKQQEFNMAIEKEKRSLIDETFQEALEKLRSMSKEEYIKLLESRISGTLKNEDVKQVMCPPDRKEETEEVLSRLGLKADIVPGENIKEGVKIIGDDFEYDLTFESILSQKKKELEPEVARILFS